MAPSNIGGVSSIVGTITAAPAQHPQSQSHLESHGSTLFTGIKYLEELVARAEQNAMRLLGPQPEAVAKAPTEQAPTEQVPNSVIERLNVATSYFHGLLARLHLAIERLESL